MNAPGPPPTIPRCRRRRGASVLAPLTIFSPLSEFPESPLDKRRPLPTQLRVTLSLREKPRRTGGSAVESEHATVGLLVRAGTGEIVEGRLCRFDDVIGDEGSAFARALLGALDTALPFEDGPAFEAVLSQLRKNRLEIDLTV